MVGYDRLLVVGGRSSRDPCAYQSRACEFHPATVAFFDDNSPVASSDTQFTPSNEIFLRGKDAGRSQYRSMIHFLTECEDRR